MNELAIKPSIQHFRLVAETEEKIRTFVESFIRSKIVSIGELLAEEKTRWIYFSSRGMSIRSLPKELVENLDLYHYKNGRVYFIYPTLINHGNYYLSSIREGSLGDIDNLISNMRLFKDDKSRKWILKLIKEGVIIPIRKADYVEEGRGRNTLYKQEDYIRKYKINLDHFEKKFSEDLKAFIEYSREIVVNGHQRSLRYVVNKYGQPIPIIEDDSTTYKSYFGMKSAKIEIDQKKGHLRLITNFRWYRCVVLIDIKTNSLVGIKREPVKNNVYYYT